MATSTLRIWDSAKCESILIEVNNSELVPIPTPTNMSFSAHIRSVFEWCDDNEIDANLVTASDNGRGYIQSFYINDIQARSLFILRWR